MKRIVEIIVCWLLIVAFRPLPAEEWTAIRGTDGVGWVSPGGILAREATPDLQVRWKRSLGSGYSSIVITGDRLVTMSGDGVHDQVVCLDRDHGGMLWETATGPHFKGENGSFDGPIATPVIEDDRVYALDPGGQLFCLDLDSGAEVWSVDLVADLGATKPLYGFATSPIVVSEKLIVQTGVAEASLAAFDLDSGEVIWAASDDRINSQTPAVTVVEDQTVILAAGGEKLTGVDPANGEILFEYEHEGGNGSAMVPVVLHGQGVALTLDDSFSKAVTIRREVDGQFDILERWQQRSIKNTYNVPVLVGEHLFAYSTRILTCVEAASGKSVWKSREPGDGFLIAADDHLIISTKQGGLHLAPATDSGYDELAHVDLFADLVWSIPAYSDNAIYVRSLSEIARVDIVGRGTQGVASGQDDVPMGKQFAQLIQALDQIPDPDRRSAAITRYLQAQSSFPIIEQDVVHFVYRGSGHDVALASDIFGARQERQMLHVEGTDFHYYTLKLEDDQRANYIFLVDFKPQTDPLNPRTVTSSMYAGEMEFAVRLRHEKPLEMSWFGMSAWREPDYLQSSPGSQRGEIHEHAIKGDTLAGDIEIEVYTPPGYEQDPSRRYRTVYVFGGPTVRSIGKLDAAADNLFSTAEDRAAILVFVSPTRSPSFGDAMGDELIAYVDREYRTKADRDHRALAGFGFAAGGALNALASRPELFSAIALQSPLLFDAAQAHAAGAMDKIEKPFAIYIDWGRFDMYNPHENWDVRQVCQQLYEHCQTNPMLKLRGGMVNDSADWASWRNRYREVLMLGAEPGEG